MDILADIGGTTTRIAASDGAAFGEPVLFNTPQDFNVALEVFAREVGKLGNPTRIIAGLPGVLSPEKLMLVRAPHLRSWEGKNISNALSMKLGAEVHLENDAALDALGEATAGAGEGSDIVAYITVGTGVGGARIVGGEIDLSAMGFEIGHQYLFVDGEPQELEQLISGSALQMKYHKHPREITDAAVWEECARLLAFGVHNSILHWSPNAVVLGGSMMKEVGISITRVEKHLSDIMKIFPRLPALRRATLGDVAGLHGALAYTKSI